MDWHKVNNWGNYGVYGWGLGIWHSRGPGASEEFIVLQIGPFKAMWTRSKQRIGELANEIYAAFGTDVRKYNGPARIILKDDVLAIKGSFELVRDEEAGP